MATERESLQEEVERLQEVLHSDDDDNTSRSSVGGDLPLYIAEHDDQSDQIDDDGDVQQSETDDQKPTERTRFDIGSSLDVINELETDGDSLTTCLTFNVVYQKIIEEMLHTVGELRADNKARRDTIEGRIMPRKKKKVKSEDSKFCSTLRTPYFSYNNTFPSSNSDVALKASRNEIDPVNSFPAMWTVRERKALISAIRDDAMKKALQPCLNKIDVELDKLNHQSDRDVKKLIKERIADINEQIERIKLYSNEKLLAEVIPSKVDWLKISSLDLKGIHDATSCQLMWNNVLRPQINRFPWTKNEEMRLKDLIRLQKLTNWSQISELLACNRTPFQCLQHYEQHIRKDSFKPWTPGEDAMLHDVVNICRIGNRIPWNQVSFYLEGRGPNQCIYRYSLINPFTKHGRWTKDEDKLLAETVGKLGTNSWMTISGHIASRTAPQCRERYMNKLHPDLKTGEWDVDEEIRLIQLVRQYGIRWSRIAQEMPGRTDARCKCHYQRIYRQHKLRRLKNDQLRSVMVASWSFLPSLKTKRQHAHRMKREEEISESEEEEEKGNDFDFTDPACFDRRNSNVKQHFMDTTMATDRIRTLVRERREQFAEQGIKHDTFVTNLIPSTPKDREILLELRRMYPEKSLRKVLELARVLCGERIRSRRKRGRPLKGQEKRVPVERICRRGEIQAKQLDANLRRTLKNYDENRTYEAMKEKPAETVTEKGDEDVSSVTKTAANYFLDNLRVNIDEDRYNKYSVGNKQSKQKPGIPHITMSGKMKPSSELHRSYNTRLHLEQETVRVMDSVRSDISESFVVDDSLTGKLSYLPPTVSTLAAFRELTTHEALYKIRFEKGCMENSKRRGRVSVPRVLSGRPRGRPRKSPAKPFGRVGPLVIRRPKAFRKDGEGSEEGEGRDDNVEGDENGREDEEGAESEDQGRDKEGDKEREEGETMDIHGNGDGGLCAVSDKDAGAKNSVRDVRLDKIIGLTRRKKDDATDDPINGGSEKEVVGSEKETQTYVRAETDKGVSESVGTENVSVENGVHESGDAGVQSENGVQSTENGGSVGTNQNDAVSGCDKDGSDYTHVKKRRFDEQSYDDDDECQNVGSSDDGSRERRTYNVDKMTTFKEILKTTEYKRLKARFHAMFMWPAVMAKARLPRDPTIHSIASPIPVLLQEPDESFAFPSASNARYIRSYDAVEPPVDEPEMMEAELLEPKIDESDPSPIPKWTVPCTKPIVRKSSGRRKSQGSTCNITEKPKKQKRQKGSQKVTPAPDARVNSVVETYNRSRNKSAESIQSLERNEFYLFSEFDYGTTGPKCDSSPEKPPRIPSTHTSPTSIDLDPEMVEKSDRPVSPIPCLSYAGRNANNRESDTGRVNVNKQKECGLLKVPTKQWMTCRKDSASGNISTMRVGKVKAEAPEGFIQYVMVTPKTGITLQSSTEQLQQEAIKKQATKPQATKQKLTVTNNDSDGESDVSSLTSPRAAKEPTCDRDVMRPSKSKRKPKGRVVDVLRSNGELIEIRNTAHDENNTRIDFEEKLTHHNKLHTITDKDLTDSTRLTYNVVKTAKFLNPLRNAEYLGTIENKRDKDHNQLLKAVNAKKVMKQQNSEKPAKLRVPDEPAKKHRRRPQKRDEVTEMEKIESAVKAAEKSAKKPRKRKIPAPEDDKKIEKKRKHVKKKPKVKVKKEETH